MGRQSQLGDRGPGGSMTHTQAPHLLTALLQSAWNQATGKGLGLVPLLLVGYRSHGSGRVMRGYEHRGALRGTPGSVCPQPEPNATELPSCAPISARGARRVATTESRLYRIPQLAPSHLTIVVASTISTMMMQKNRARRTKTKKRKTRKTGGMAAGIEGMGPGVR